MQPNQRGSVSELCVVACVNLLWSVILLHSSRGGNLTADMLIAAQGKSNVCVFVCESLVVKASDI